MGIISSEQSREIKLTQLDRGPFLFRFASYRKSEDAKLNLRSEDYLVSDVEKDRAIFVLCDGVGSSFYGDIGSQILGETVLNWLQNIKFQDVLSGMKGREGSNWLKNIHTNLQTYLDSQVKFASSIVEQKDITTGKDNWTQLAEKNQRDQFGTQSNFVGGIIWPKSANCPDGIVLLFWLGNARIRLFSRERELTYLLRWGEDLNQLREVWSSREGVIGCVHSYVTDLSDIEYVIGYSDGLEEAENLIYPGISSEQFETIVNQAQSIKDDDVSFFEISTSVPLVVGQVDDIALSVREHFKAPVIIQHDVNGGGSNQEIETLKRQIRSLIKKIDENKLLLEKTKQRTKIAVVIASLIFLCMGFLFSYLLNPNREVIVYRPVYMTVEPEIIYKYWPTPKMTVTPTPNPTLTLTQTVTNQVSPSPISVRTGLPTQIITKPVLLPQTTTPFQPSTGPIPTLLNGSETIQPYP